MRPIKARSRRWPRMKGMNRDEKEGEARNRERETGKENRKSAEYSRRRRRKIGKIGLKSVWRKSETEASMVIRGFRKDGNDVVVVSGDPIGGVGR
ncbi:hypothetical protein PVK06_045532 [Gossypium arboreum]|uniref:Uncharacterized protein n=1 Tax=Gossypium arboreum TaxID=29729 RepID=A0ABR0MUB2_GOSAR|nr:hypothetical protein PVK06_045532 [Gossypium arboreum]